MPVRKSKPKEEGVEIIPLTKEEILRDCSVSFEKMLKELEGKHSHQIGVTLNMSPIQRVALAVANAVLRELGMAVTSDIQLQFIVGDPIE